MVEVIHRIITDASRLTKTWFDGVISQGLKVEEYVEILATLAHCWGIDEFCRVIGVPPNELPEPKAGEPSYYRSEQVIEDSVFGEVVYLADKAEMGLIRLIPGVDFCTNN